MYKATREDAYHVLCLLLPVEWLCDIQITSGPVDGEKADRFLISSWTSDAVIDLPYFVLVRADLDKAHRP